MHFLSTEHRLCKTPLCCWLRKEQSISPKGFVLFLKSLQVSLYFTDNGKLAISHGLKKTV